MFYGIQGERKKMKKISKASHTFWIFLTLAVFSASSLELPEELTGERCSHEHTINLPTAGKCLVPVTTAYEWTVAQTKCEQVKGTLYTLPSGNLAARPQLLRCLESSNGNKFNDMWINGVSLWSPQFRWVDGSLMHRVKYCTVVQPPIPPGENMTSSLNVDSCVTHCQERKRSFTVVQATNDALGCYCLNQLHFEFQATCPSPAIDYNDAKGMFFIVPSEAPLIDVSGGSTFSTTDILCAMVDNNTFADGYLKSQSCFTRRPFLCTLDSTTTCDQNPTCNSQQCNFMVGKRCVKRVNFPYSWYSARDFCKKEGGDLWVYFNEFELQGIAKHLTSDSKFWIGATNYQWQFDPNSAKLYPLHGDFRTARCAHIYRQRQPTGRFTRRMEWSDTPCDQAKSFLCEFDRETFKASDIGKEVTCPWDIIDVPGPLPPVTQGSVGSDDGDSFPLAAVISGIVAGLTLLTCLGLIWGLCFTSRRRLTKERVAYVPYFAGDQSHVEFETMSNADHMRGNMRSASEHGSQTGLVKGGYHNSSSYGMSHSNAEFSSKSLDRRHLEAMEKKFSESQQYLANTSMDERAFSSYQTMPAKSRDYMTLQANMTIQDEAELAAMRRSLRGKPEVTLVTDNMDMNFTVNHAHGTSRTGSELERSMDELHLPSSASGYEHRNRSFTHIALHDL